MSQSGGRSPARTIKKAVSLGGVGIHSGAPSKITFLPSNSGEVFFVFEGKRIKPLAHFVTDTKRGTTIKNISVVEHVLSAINGLGISSLEIALTASEPPVMDGSAKPFVEALLSAEIVEIDGFRPLLEIKKPIRVFDDFSSIEVVPFNGFEVNFMVDFPIIGSQSFDYKGNYGQEIAPARTFGFVKELEKLKALGLALGANIDNALAIGDEGYVNEPRFKDEPVRHKILDIIGDLFLCGKEIRGRVIAKKSSHKLNVELAKILENLN